MSDATPSPIPAEDLVIVRVIDAPQELVFKLWSEARHLAQWWGPSGFTNPVCEFEAHAGGLIHVHMRSPDGSVFPMGGLVEEASPPNRLVFVTTAHADEDGEPSIVNRNTVTFENFDAHTKMTLAVRVLEATPEAAGALAGMNQGWSESLERLLDLAGAEARTQARHIVASRVVEAPREVVWKAWTEANELPQWWGPDGFTCTIQEMDVRPGGIWRMVMHGPDGVDYPNTHVYAGVVAPQLLVYDHAAAISFRFCVSLIPAGAKATRVTVRMLFPSEEVRERCAREFRAVEGLDQTLSRLADWLSQGCN